MASRQPARNRARQETIGDFMARARSAIGAYGEQARQAAHDAYRWAALADYFMEPYPRRGMGAHLVGRRHNLPPWFTDSRFNVLRPEGVARGEIAMRHYETDLDFHGGPVPRRFGGGGWSGKALGFKKLGPVPRLVLGAPEPAKTLAARAGGFTAFGGG